MRGAIHRVDRDAAPGDDGVGIHLAQRETRLQQAAQAGVDALLGNKTFLNGLIQVGVFASALEIRSVSHRVRASGGGIRLRLVMPFEEEIADGSAIAHHQVLVPPLFSQYLLQQAVAPAARLPVEALVRAHHLFHVGLLHKRLESGQISLP